MSLILFLQPLDDGRGDLDGGWRRLEVVDLENDDTRLLMCTSGMSSSSSSVHGEVTVLTRFGYFWGLGFINLGIFSI